MISLRIAVLGWKHPSLLLVSSHPRLVHSKAHKIGGITVSSDDYFKVYFSLYRCDLSATVWKNN